MEIDQRVTFLILVILLVTLIRWLLGRLDAQRIQSYIEERGGRLLSSKWAPFGSFWWGADRSRIYEIHYVDAQGNEHEAVCKTNMIAGVFLTEDHIVSEAPPQDVGDFDLEEKLASLERENHDLRERLEKLEGAS